MGAAANGLIGKLNSILRWEKCLHGFQISDPIFPEKSAAFIKIKKKIQSCCNYVCTEVQEM